MNFNQTEYERNFTATAAINGTNVTAGDLQNYYPLEKGQGEVHSVSIFPCERAEVDEPCRFRFGVNYTISVNFTSFVNTTAPRSTILARDDTVVPTVRYPYSGQTFDGCAYTGCPITANIPQVYNYTMSTLKSVRFLSLAAIPPT
ncbi:hypothetical protein T439DRAFT_292042 [Meredithblackwellia eburnea MCA 4105]